MANAPSSDKLLCEMSSIWSAPLTLSASHIFIIPKLQTLLYDILSFRNVLLFLRNSPMVTVSFWDILLCEISNVWRAVCTCSLLIWILHISLYERLRLCSVLLFLRHSMMATAPSSEMLFSDKLSVCKVVLVLIPSMICLIAVLDIAVSDILNWLSVWSILRKSLIITAASSVMSLQTILIVFTSTLPYTRAVRRIASVLLNCSLCPLLTKHSSKLLLSYAETKFSVS